MRRILCTGAALILGLYPHIEAKEVLDKNSTEYVTRQFSKTAADIIEFLPSTWRSDPKEGLPAFIRDLGVPFPDGTSVAFTPQGDRIVVTHNLYWLAAIGNIIDVKLRGPHQIEINVTLIEFDLDEIASHPEMRRQGWVSQEAVLGLWRNGKGRLVNSSKIVTLSGVSCSYEDVHEIIYPASYSAAPDGGSSPNGIRAPILVPDFETREVGYIVNVTPISSPSRRFMNITLSPEFCELVEWQEYAVAAEGDESLAPIVKQPVFHSHNASASVVVEDGETLVLGGNRMLEEDMVGYFLLSARAIGTNGHPLNETEKEGE